jgi:antirestriction protein ArdC
MDIKWSALLQEAVTKPGIVSTAYSTFHGYSLGNQLLAFSQCHERDMPVGPIATYAKWQSLGRQVKRGQRAITLCMPVTFKAKDETDKVITRFVFRPNWFVLSQTDGADYTAPTIPDWDKQRALSALQITLVPFDCSDGNTQGYALQNRQIAISPIAALPHKTLFHELAHVCLGHLETGNMADGERPARDIREVEAESVAMLCCESLGLDGVEFSRGYIQHWNSSGGLIPETSAQRIFKAADSILRAGRSL